jgi:hypothetical protein
MSTSLADRLGWFSRPLVVVVIVHRPDPSPAEQASLQQLRLVLGQRPILLLHPCGMTLETYRRLAPEIGFQAVDPRHLASYQAFARFKHSLPLYWSLRRYRFILFYELDAWIFRDDLDQWIASGYDNIGAPWFEGWYPAPGEPLRLQGAGNGGFCLRRTSACLRVLLSFAYLEPLREVIPRRLNLPRTGKPAWLRSCLNLISALAHLSWANNTFFLFDNWNGPEDLFWSQLVPRAHRWFRNAPPEVAARFSFEVHPDRLYALTGQLPTGCHKWPAFYDSFWKDHFQAPVKPPANASVSTATSTATSTAISPAVGTSAPPDASSAGHTLERP